MNNLLRHKDSRNLLNDMFRDLAYAQVEQKKIENRIARLERSMAFMHRAFVELSKSVERLDNQSAKKVE